MKEKQPTSSRSQRSKEAAPEKSKQPTPIVLTGSAGEAESLFQSPQYAPSYTFPWNPDPLCSGNSYRIYDEMRHDDQVKAAVALKKDFVINTGWTIKCEDEKVRDFVTQTLSNINQDNPCSQTFEDCLRDMLSAYEYGFSISELIYKLEDQGEWAGKYIYNRMKTRPPHSFRFNLDKYGNVEKVVQSSSEGDLPLDPSKLLHHVYQQEFGNPYGQSDFRAAHLPYKVKKHCLKFWAVYLEVFSKPIKVVRYKKNMADDEIAQLKKVVEHIQDNTTVVVPEDALIDLLMASRDSTDSYEKAANYFNTSIARAILVPDLLGMSGKQTSGGSFSLGSKQFEVFLGTIGKDRKSMAKKITNHVVRSLVRLNFGDGYKAEFEFLPFSEEKIVEYAKLWVEAVKGNMWEASDEEINHLRKLTGFPEGDVERPAQGLGIGDMEIDPKTGQPIMVPGRKPGQKISAGGKNGVKVDGDDEDKKTAKFSMRALTTYEAKVNFRAISSTLDQADESAVRESLARGREIWNDLIEQVRGKGLLRRFSPEKMNTLQPKFLKGMNLALRGHFQDLYQEGYSEAEGEIIKAPRRFTEALLPEEFLRLIEAESFKITGDYTNEMTKRMRNLIADGIRDGIGEAAIINLIREQLKDASEQWMRTMVRTKTTDIYNQARRSYWENDELAKLMVVAYQFSAVMDSRTSEICSHLDERVYDVGGEISRVTPPLHFNCRSLLVPVTKFEEYKAESVPSLESIHKHGGGLKNYSTGGAL